MSLDHWAFAKWIGSTFIFAIYFFSRFSFFFFLLILIFIWLVVLDFSSYRTYSLQFFFYLLDCVCMPRNTTAHLVSNNNLGIIRVFCTKWFCWDNSGRIQFIPFVQFFSGYSCFCCYFCCSCIIIIYSQTIFGLCRSWLRESYFSLFLYLTWVVHLKRIHNHNRTIKTFVQAFRLLWFLWWEKERNKGEKIVCTKKLK